MLVLTGAEGMAERGGETSGPARTPQTIHAVHLPDSISPAQFARDAAVGLHEITQTASGGELRGDNSGERSEP